MNTCTYIDGPVTFPPEIWADPDIDSKRTMDGCESSNPTTTSTIGKQEATDEIYFIWLAERGYLGIRLLESIISKLASSKFSIF